MSITRAYESSNGDSWDLVRDDVTAELRVRHSPNPASGGQSSEMTLAEFLRLEPHSPQHRAVTALTSSEATAEHVDPARVKGYVHEPKMEGGPYIAVVLIPEGAPAVTVHKTQEEAELQLNRTSALMKQTTHSRLRGDHVLRR